MFEIDTSKINELFTKNKKKRTFHENIDSNQFYLMDYLKQLKEILKDYTQADLAEMLDVTERAVQFWVAEENAKVPQKRMIGRIDELFTKIKKQGLTKDQILNEPAVPYQQQRFEKKNTENDFLVPFVDIPAQAGYTKAYQQIDYIATLKKYPILPDVDPTGLTWRYFQIAGDSMEPEIMEGDTILCSQVNKEDWQSIKNYYTHVIVTDDSLWIKDIYRDTETQWFLLSQNEAYKPMLISVEEIKQVWVMRRHIKGRVKKHRRYDIDEIKKQISSGKSAKAKWVNPHPFQKLKDK